MVVAPAEVVKALASLHLVVGGVDVASCTDSQRRDMVAAARVGQQAIESLLMRIGMAADQRAAQVGGAPDAHGALLGDGRKVRGATARREAARSQTAAAMDKVGAAVERGELGGPQVDAITQAARGLTNEQRLQLDTDAMIEAARSDPADVFAARVRREAERIKGDHGLADTKAKQAASTWRHWFDERSGMGKIHAEFDPERYEAIVNAVEGHLTRIANQGGANKTPGLAATAAYELLTGASADRGGQGGARPHINVIVDLDTFVGGGHPNSVRETCAGHRLPPESISRLACDAVVRRVVLDERGVPVDVGRRSRTATDAQWQAIRSMYAACAWNNCDRPLAWCQVHHIHEWENGGPTDLCNLVPLCNRHHHAVHEGGWTVKLDRDRRLDIHRPDGAHHATTYPDRVTRGPCVADPVEAEGP